LQVTAAGKDRFPGRVRLVRSLFTGSTIKIRTDSDLESSDNSFRSILNFNNNNFFNNNNNFNICVQEFCGSLLADPRTELE
jgi:hypothetical protein